MVDHLLVYHPGLRNGSRTSIDDGALGDRTFYMYGNRQNLGIVRPDENALWSLGCARHLRHDLARRRTARRRWRHGVTSYLQPGVEDVVFGHCGSRPA